MTLINSSCPKEILGAGFGNDTLLDAFLFLVLEKERGHVAGSSLAPPETDTNGHEGGVRGLGIGYGLGGGGGWAGWRWRRGWWVPPVHYTPDSSLITPAEPLRPSHPSSPPLSSTYKTHSPRWWQPIPPAPTAVNTTHNTCPSSKQQFLLSSSSGKVTLLCLYISFLSACISLPPLSLSISPHPPPPPHPPHYFFLTPSPFLPLSLSLSLWDKWVLIKGDRAMKLKEGIPWPAIAPAWAWHWHI